MHVLARARGTQVADGVVMNKLVGLTVTGFMLALAACSGASSTPETIGTDDPIKGAGETRAPAAAKSPAKDSASLAAGAGTPATTPDPVIPPAGTPGTDGQPGRISVNEHCCYGATYFKCPNAVACFGGFDGEACLAKCGGNDARADACSAQEDAAGAPDHGASEGRRLRERVDQPLALLLDVLLDRGGAADDGSRALDRQCDEPCVPTRRLHLELRDRRERRAEHA